MGGQLGAKRLELLHELMPRATVVGVLVNPTNPIVAEAQTNDWQTAASALGMQLHVLHATNERDFEAVFMRMRDLKAQALVIGPRFSDGQSDRAARHADGPTRHTCNLSVSILCRAGGLVSYGEHHRRNLGRPAAMPAAS